MQERPKVGLAVFVVKDRRILLGKRKGSHGSGTWCLPGGHLEFGEELEECAARETKEEAGVEIKNVRFGTITNDIFRGEGKHYITIFMLAEYRGGEPKVMEPERCERWGWFSWDKLPEPLFLPIVNLKKRGYSPLV